MHVGVCVACVRMSACICVRAYECLRACVRVCCAVLVCVRVCVHTRCVRTCVCCLRTFACVRISGRAYKGAWRIRCACVRAYECAACAGMWRVR